MGAVNGGYIAKRNDGDCEDVGRGLIWLLVWECRVAALKTAQQGGGSGLFFFFSLVAFPLLVPFVLVFSLFLF